MKTLVIGVDAATWDRLDPLVEAGELPTLGRLAKDGVSGDLTSTTPPMTPLAWTSMATGCNPGKHGIYDFFEIDRTNYDLTTTDFTDMNRPAVWDIFDAEDIDAGVFNFPVAFPPPEVGSFFVSGVPSEMSQPITHPPELRQQLEEFDYEVQPDETATEGLERYFEAISDHASTQGEVLKTLIEDNDLDHCWAVFMGIDWAQHYLWDTEIDGENAVDRLYQLIDDIVGELLGVVDDEVTVVVVSDHGARSIDAEVHLNTVLAERGYLSRPDGADASALEQARLAAIDTGWKVGKVLPLPLRNAIKRVMPAEMMDEIEKEVGVGHETITAEIDWSSSDAFAYGYMGRVFIHETTEFVDGTVDPETYKSVRSELVEELGSLTHPDTGEPLVEDVLFAEEVYHGDRVGEAADLLVIPVDWRFMLYGDFGEEWIHEPKDRIADHDPTGVLIANGPGMNGEAADATVADIAPTLLALHGLPVTDEMDGSAIPELIGDEIVESVPEHQYVAERERGGRTDEEEQAAQERLKDLGYL